MLEVGQPAACALGALLEGRAVLAERCRVALERGGAVLGARGPLRELSDYFVHGEAVPAACSDCGRGVTVRTVAHGKCDLPETAAPFSPGHVTAWPPR